MRIGICDDEKTLRKDLRKVVEVHLELSGVSYTIEEYDSGESLLADQARGPELDLLFLDIEMPGLDGMETAQRLREVGEDMVIVFVTAFPDYVFQGYEVQAFHYILKPYDRKKICQVLDRAMEAAHLRQEQYYVVEQKSGTLRLPLSAVCYFKSDRRSVEAVCEDGSRRTFYGKLDEIETSLPGCYQRVHNRYLVNLRHVSRVEGTKCVCGGEELPVSRTYKQALAVAFARMLLD